MPMTSTLLLVLACCLGSSWAFRPSEDTLHKSLEAPSNEEGSKVDDSAFEVDDTAEDDMEEDDETVEVGEGAGKEDDEEEDEEDDEEEVQKYDADKDKRSLLSKTERSEMSCTTRNCPAPNYCKKQKCMRSDRRKPMHVPA
mmetsp:Transcript_35671/g.65411  ORF Transcript_35671/g.65411 Transcript_35671/m.65411 type:complete len:141 (-) Transcript_35671:90-512(-)